MKIELGWLAGSRIALAIAVISNLVASFALQIIVIRFAGLSATTDLYIATQTLPTVLTAVICVSLQGVWLHRLTNSEAGQGLNKSNYRKAITQATGIAFVTSITFMLATPLWFGVIFPGSKGIDPELIYQLSALSWGAAATTIASFPCVLFLRLQGRFLEGEIVLLALALASLKATQFFLGLYGILGAAVVLFVKAFALSSFYFLMCGFKTAFTSYAKKHSAKRTGDLYKLLAANSIFKTMPVIDRFLGSQASAGSITGYNLATSGVGAVASLLDRVICSPATSAFGRLVQARDYKTLRRSYQKVLFFTAIFVAGGSILMLLFFGAASNLLGQLIGSPKEVGEHVVILAILLSGTLYAGASGNVLVAGFYAMGDTRTPIAIGVFGFFWGIVLKIILFHFYGMYGLALAASIYLVMNTTTFYIFLERKILTEV